MPVPTITEFETQIHAAKDTYTTSLQDTLKLLSGTPSSTQVQTQITSLHKAGVDFFNLFGRSIDEYGLPYFELNIDVKNCKIEDAVSIIDTIIFHWQTLKTSTTKYNISCPVASPSSYASIQRLIKKFEPNKINALKNKFMEENLPTNGFDDKKEHSGWKIGSPKLTVTQIVIGLILTAVSGFLIFKWEILTGMQYMFSRALLSLGLTLIGSALLEGTVKLNWTIQKSVVIKAAGWVALFIMLYYMNPPSAPTP